MVDIMTLSLAIASYLLIGLLVSSIIVYCSRKKEFDFGDVTICLFWPLAIIVMLAISASIAIVIAIVATGDRIVGFLIAAEEKYRESFMK